MSIHKTRFGTWEVRYRADGKNRSNSFKKKRDALDFENALNEIKEQAHVKGAVDEARRRVLGQ